MQHYDKQKRQQGLFDTQQGVAPVRSSRLIPTLVVVLHGGERELGTYHCDQSASPTGHRRDAPKRGH